MKEYPNHGKEEEIDRVRGLITQLRREVSGLEAQLQRLDGKEIRPEDFLNALAQQVKSVKYLLHEFGGGKIEEK